MQDKYDLPNLRPATNTRKRVLLLNTTPWACRRLKSVLCGTIFLFFVLLPFAVYGGVRVFWVGVPVDAEIRPLPPLEV